MKATVFTRDSFHLLSFVFIVTLFLLISTSSFALKNIKPKTRIYIAELDLADSLKKNEEIKTPDLIRSMADVFTHRGGFEVVTNLEIKEVYKQKERAQAMGLDEYLYDESIAKLSKADAMLRTSLGESTGKLVLNGSLVYYQEGRIVNRNTLAYPSPYQTPIAGEVLARRLLGEQVDMPMETPSQKRKRLAKEKLAESFPTTNQESPRILVMLRKTSSDLLDAGAKSALERRVAEKIATVVESEVFTSTEVADILEKESLSELIGDGNDASLSAVAQKVQAPHLVAMNIGQVGNSVLVSASLLATRDALSKGRSSLVLPGTEQVAEAAVVVSLGLFGENVELPPPPVPPNRFELGMERLMADIKTEFATYRENPLSRIAVLPLVNHGDEAIARNLGMECSSYLFGELWRKYEIPVIKEDKLKELENIRDLSTMEDWTDEDIKEVGRFLGSSVVVTGRVADIGNDFLITLRMTDTGMGEPLNGSTAFIPMGERGTLLKKMFVARTKAGAMYRAILPGWGQFYNGPKHYWKGGVILGGFLAGVAGGATAMVLSSQTMDKRDTWDRGGDKFLANCTTDPTMCINKRKSLKSDADTMMVGAMGAFSVAAAFWVWGFVDAAIYGEDYSQEVYGVP